MKNKRIAGKKNKWKKKQNRLVPKSEETSLTYLNKAISICSGARAIVRSCVVHYKELYALIV